MSLKLSQSLRNIVEASLVEPWGIGFERTEHIESRSFSIVNAEDQFSYNMSILMLPSNSTFGWNICFNQQTIRLQSSVQNVNNDYFIFLVLAKELNYQLNSKKQ
uniref:Uncharacterized protein n=1 Tax=Cucumis melo TaxID=3656 RepID=A0A9I9EB39_CUCME